VRIVTANPGDGVRAPEPTELAGTFRIGRWPFGILVIATLRIIDAVSLAAIGLGLQGLPLDGLPIVASNPVLTRAVDLVLAGATILGVIGLLSFQRWGWILTMVLVGVGLAIELIRVAIGQPDHLGLLLLVVSAFYLNQRSVRAMAGRDLLDDAKRAPDG
jgi:hypothetical protein